MFSDEIEENHLDEDYPEVNRPAPTPEGLLVEAEHEIDKKVLDGYGPVIKTLRDQKNFSYREIAEWLTERGIPSDHNSVYRAYMKSLSREARANELAREEFEADRPEEDDDEE